ncbi:MAG: DUF1735 domain-containing protein [Mucilaginibacter sp.]
MKKRLYLITTILLSAAVLSLSSCLKDSRFVDFSKVGTIVEFPLGGTQNFAKDAITDAADTVTKQFAVNVASPTAPSTATKITLAVDNTIITSYNASQNVVNYLPFPTGSFSFTSTSITIPAGQRVAIVSVTFYKNQLDPSKSYMLPIRIANAGGLNISGNMGIHYYHVIGNPFAGTYNWHFERRNNGTGAGAPAGGSFDDVVQIGPVTPTQFEVTSGYYVATERYEVSYTQVDANDFKAFNVILNADDITNIFTANGITVVQQPVIFDATYNANTTYTFAQSLVFLHYQYIVQNSSGFRYLIDQYTKP